MRPIHHAAAKWLADHDFDGLTRDQQAAGIGVGRKTFFTWLADPGFKALYREAQDEWRRSFDHIALTHRRKRIEELVAIYNETPAVDFAGSADVLVRKRLPNGTEVEQIEKRPIVRRNALVRAKLLEQIAAEVGGNAAEELESLKLALGLRDQADEQANGNGHPYLKVAVGGNGHV